MFSYEDFLRARPLEGRADLGEIEILPLEKANPELGPYGPLFQSPWWSLVRDPVRFPGGKEDGYIRMIPGNPHQDQTGVAVFAIHPRKDSSSEILMVWQYRHAVGRWMLEAPRGFLDFGEEPADAAMRELHEETGFTKPDLLLPLGSFYSDSGLTNCCVAGFAAVFLDHTPKSFSCIEPTEAIQGSLWIPMEDWTAGRYQPPIPNRPVGGMDSFTLAMHSLATASGKMSQMERAWSTLWGAPRHQGRLDPELVIALRQKQTSFSVEIHCTDEQRLRADLPRVQFEREGSSVLSATDLTPLELCWIACDPTVSSLRPLPLSVAR